jgi:hypothetical protein
VHVARTVSPELGSEVVHGEKQDVGLGRTLGGGRGEGAAQGNGEEEAHRG